MTILCCPVRLHPVTQECLSQIRGVEIVDLPEADRYAYWRAIKERWTGEEDLLIIEHDMEFTREMVDEILDCPKEWCARAYNISTELTTGCLGFTKFSAKVQRMLKPEILESAMRQCDLCHGEYWHLDFHLTDTARVAGFWVHSHGIVKHLHEYLPQIPFMKITGKTPQQFRTDLTTLMKERGWKGPAAYNSHEHTSDCKCVWVE